MSSAMESVPNKKRPETLSIKMQDIPTDLLERLLADFVQQINTVYRKKQGDIVIKDIEDNAKLSKASCEFERRRPKRTLGEISQIHEDYDVKEEIKERQECSNLELEKLGISHDEVLDLPLEKVTTTGEPIASVISASIFEVMQQSIRSKYPNNVVNFEKSAVALLNRFTDQHFSNLSQRLQRLMEMQRRRLPNRDDLALLQREGIFDNSGINDMYNLSNCWLSAAQNRQKVIQLNKKANAAVAAYRGADSISFNKIDDVFLNNDEWWVDRIVERKRRKHYIPEWMPPLPPDYTYKATPKFNQRISNPIALREKVVVEGRVGEAALDHIIVKNKHCFELSFSENDSGPNEKVDVDEDKTLIKSGQHKPVEGADANVESSRIVLEAIKGNEERTLKETAVQSSAADLVEIARKRMKILAERRKKEEERLSCRINSEESYFGKKFGLYTSMKKLPDGTNEELNQYRMKKLTDLVQNLQKQQRHNTKLFIEQEKIRQKVAEEKSKYAEENEIELGTGPPSDGNNFGFTNGDEEVDFDVEFSDMEDFANDTTDALTENIETTEVPLIKDISSSEATDLTSDNANSNVGTVEGDVRILEASIIDTTVSGKKPYSAPAPPPDVRTTEEESFEIKVVAEVKASEIDQVEKEEKKEEEVEEDDIDMDMFEDV